MNSRNTKFNQSNFKNQTTKNMYKKKLLQNDKTLIGGFFNGSLTGLIYPRFQTEKIPVQNVTRREQFLKNKHR